MAAQHCQSACLLLVYCTKASFILWEERDTRTCMLRVGITQRRKCDGFFSEQTPKVWDAKKEQTSVRALLCKRCTLCFEPAKREEASPLLVLQQIRICSFRCGNVAYWKNWKKHWNKSNFWHNKLFEAFTCVGLMCSDVCEWSQTELQTQIVFKVNSVSCHRFCSRLVTC